MPYSTKKGEMGMSKGNQRIKEKISEEISRIVVRYPIVASVLLRLKYGVKEHLPGLAMVDAVEKEISIRPDYEEIGESLRTILAHEAMHILNGTMIRREKRNAILWNYATDLEINWMLKDMGIDVKKGLYEKRFHGEYAENIYETLKKQATEELQDLMQELQQAIDELNQQSSSSATNRNGEKKDQNNGNGESTKEETGESEGEKRELQNKIKKLNQKILKRLGLNEDAEVSSEMEPKDDKSKTIVRQFIVEAALGALQMAHSGIGSLPGGMERLIDEFTKSKVRWQDYLEETLTTVMGDDYSFRRPYKPTLIYCDTYNPTVLNPEKSKVVVIVDTSGSIGKKELQTFLSEVQEILKQYKVTFISCDATVQKVVEDEDIEKIIKNVKGGGGTEFEPAFEWIENNVQEYGIPVILMTDGYNGDSYIPRPYNVGRIIVLTTGKDPEGLEPDFVIKVDLNE